MGYNFVVQKDVRYHLLQITEMNITLCQQLHQVKKIVPKTLQNELWPKNVKFSFLSWLTKFTFLLLTPFVTSAFSWEIQNERKNLQIEFTAALYTIDQPTLIKDSSCFNFSANRDLNNYCITRHMHYKCPQQCFLNKNIFSLTQTKNKRHSHSNGNSLWRFFVMYI